MKLYLVASMEDNEHPLLRGAATSMREAYRIIGAAMLNPEGGGGENWDVSEVETDMILDEQCTEGEALYVVSDWQGGK